MAEQMFNVEEVAAMLRTTPNVIRRAVRAKQLDTYKVGREYRFTQSQIDAYLKVVAR